MFWPMGKEIPRRSLGYTHPYPVFGWMHPKSRHHVELGPGPVPDTAVTAVLRRGAIEEDGVPIIHGPWMGRATPPNSI